MKTKLQHLKKKYLLVNLSSKQEKKMARLKAIYQRIPQWVKGLFSLGFAFFLLFLIYRKMDFYKLIFSFKNSQVHWGILLFSIIIEALANTIKAFRWQLQLTPLNLEKVSKGVLIASIWGCYSVNLLFPRMGEVWRCLFLSRRVKFAFSSIFGTLVTERLIDILMIFLLLLSAFVFFWGYTTSLLVYLGFDTRVLAVFYSPWFYIAVVLLILIFFFARHWSMATLWKRKIKLYWQQFLTGFMSIRRIQNKGFYIFLTILIYTFYFIAFYITFYAFPFTKDLGLGIGFITFIMATIGIVVPIQGGIGPWHFMCITSLVTFGLGKEEAGIFALVVHTMQTFGIAFIGLLAILFVSLPMRESKKINK